MSADPSGDETNTAWGVDALTSTQFVPSTALLVDTRLYGRVVVRESLVTRIGYSSDDFVRNVVRFVSEERLTQTIERPQAICLVSGLPVQLEADEAPAKIRK